MDGLSLARSYRNTICWFRFQGTKFVVAQQRTNILLWKTGNREEKFNFISWKDEDFWWCEPPSWKMSERTLASHWKRNDPRNAGICNVFRTRHCWWLSLDSLVLVSEIWTLSNVVCSLWRNSQIGIETTDHKN
jgi:hypothetical protein